MQAVILAGGRGLRLRHLTYKMPKPMVPINGKPFLELLIVFLKKYGIKDFLFCVGYKWKEIKRYFGRGKRFAVNINYSLENRLRGTGGALKKAADLLDENFFLINADTYLSLDYKDMLTQFYKNRKIGLLAVSKNKNSDIGNVSMKKNWIITEYRKVSIGKILNYQDAGVGIFKKKVLDFFPPKIFFSFEEEVLPKLIAQGQLKGYLCRNPFYDIGTLEGLKLFEEMIKR